MARLWYLWQSGRSGQVGAVPSWANYYLSHLPREVIPSEAKALEDWVRTFGLIMLVLPLALVVGVLLLS